MSQNHYTVEPVGYTCPLIDNIQTGAKEQMDTLTGVFHKLENAIHPDLLEELRQVNSWLSDLHDKTYSPLEEIRQANDALRSWGNQNAQERQKLEDEVDTLQDTVTELEQQIQTL